MNRLRAFSPRARQPWLLLPALFALALLAFYPFRFVFEFSTDEGINLMKALLQLHGYELYADIYSDQPPLFTHYLAALFRTLEPNVTLARLGVLSLSVLLLASALWTLQVEWGGEHALLGLVFLILIPRFAELSVSVMIGLPALALALASFALAIHWRRTGSDLTLVLSAMLMAGAILTKLLVALFGPLLGMAVLLSPFHGSDRLERGRLAMKAFLVWVGIAFGILLLAALLMGPEGWQQLTRSHLAANSAALSEELGESQGLTYRLRYSWGMLALGAAGAGYCVVRRKFAMLPLFLWSLANFALLASIMPVWYHQSLIVTVPAAALAAVPTGEALAAFRRSIEEGELQPRSVLLPLSVIFLAGAIQWPKAVRLLGEMEFDFPNLIRDEEPESIEFIHLAELSELRSEDEVIVTDRPMYAFRLGKIVPPNLAVWSGKRYETGLLTQEMIIETIETWRPSQVLLARYEVPEVEAHLAPDYAAVYHYGGFRLYQRSNN